VFAVYVEGLLALGIFMITVYMLLDVTFVKNRKILLSLYFAPNRFVS
jgi:hypothetical protein